MAHPTFTDNGTVTLDLLPGRIYSFAAAGVFDGGSILASFFLDDGSTVPIPRFPITAAGQILFTAASARMSLELEGAGTPSITYAVTLATGYPEVTPENIGAIAEGDAIPARVTTITSSATPTINTDLCDAVTITALATAITSMTTNLSGTPNNFDMLLFRIKDDGTARAITWGASYAGAGAALPTTTVLGKVLHALFIWDSVASKWCCLSTAQEA